MNDAFTFLIDLNGKSFVGNLVRLKLPLLIFTSITHRQTNVSQPHSTPVHSSCIDIYPKEQKKKHVTREPPQVTSNSYY